MFNINVTKECGCFKKSEYENNMNFESKDDALLQAQLMTNYMNTNFCRSHNFQLVENGEQFTINVHNNPEKKQSGGCCGGGHCS
jgi:hypothetical protein